MSLHTQFIARLAPLAPSSRTPANAGVLRPYALAALIVLTATLLSAMPAQARLYMAEQMNVQQYRALDKAHTVVILPGGNFEEHGIYLPTNTDGYVADAYAKDLADALVARGWDVLMFPQIPLGSSPVNEVPEIYPYPGSYNLRFDTVRALYMDLATELGTAGYKWVFVIHTHGAPNFNRALDQAGEYFSDHFDGRMVHITGRGVDGGPDPYSTLSAEAQKADAHSGHAGIDETSLMLYIRPDLVNPDYKNAPDFPATAANGGMPEVGKQKGWLGYFGAPRYSSAEYGAKLYHATLDAYIKQALKVLDGAARPQSRGSMPLRKQDKDALARDAGIERQEQEWIKANGQP